MELDETLQGKVRALPDAPGVYLMKDRRGAVVYVGKAKSLRSRVRSYFSSSEDGRLLLPFLRGRIADFDTLVTANEKEAFLLENNLIKQHRPRYNVRLVDDKTYLSLRLDRRHAFPRFTTVRAPKDDGSRYFGPYASARSVRATLKVIYQTFGIRSCSDAVLANRSRPCLYYQIGQCLAPCVGYVAEAQYGEALEQAEMLLAGRDRELLARLQDDMARLAEGERFEEAAVVRDRIRSVERTLERQHVATARDIDFDAVGHAALGSANAFVWLHVRDGRVIDTSTLRVTDRGNAPAAEVLKAVLLAAYESRQLPGEVATPFPPDDHELLEETLSERRGARVAVRVPERGLRRRLVELAVANAAQTLEMEAHRDGRNRALLASLQELLDLKRLPRRIECFDISNLQGTLAVGSMVVAIDGEPAPSEYRHYRIRSVRGADDYAMMREVLSRRLTRGIDEGVLPDLLVVDGGPGQLSIARSVAEELGAREVALIGLAKGPHRNAGRETIHTLDRAEPLALAHGDRRLHLLQRVRDEAHRFAITYHRKLRAHRDRTSALRAVPGLGPVRTKALLRAFGSVDGVRAASREELSSVAGMTARAATATYQALHPAAPEALEVEGEVDEGSAGRASAADGDGDHVRRGG